MPNSQTPLVLHFHPGIEMKFEVVPRNVAQEEGRDQSGERDCHDDEERRERELRPMVGCANNPRRGCLSVGQG
jgi:hypothetical protein